VLFCLGFQRSDWSDAGLASMRMALNLATHGSPAFNLGEPAATGLRLLGIAPVTCLCLLGLSPFTAAALLGYGLVAAADGMFWRDYLASRRPLLSDRALRRRFSLAAGLTLFAAAFAWLGATRTGSARTETSPNAARDATVMRELHTLNARRWSSDFGRPDGRRIAVVSRMPGYDGLRLGPAQMVLPWQSLADPRVTGDDPHRPLEIAGAAGTDGRAELNNFGKRWGITTAASGSLDLQLRLARGQIDLAEPICSLGDPASGVQFMVRRDAEAAVRFLVRSGGTVRASRLSPPLDFGRVHDWSIAWEPSRADSIASGRIRLRLDRRLLGDWILPMRPFRNEDVLIGWNTQGDGACLSRFGGAIVGVGARPDARGEEAAKAVAQPDARPELGPGFLIQARVTLAQGFGHNEPIVTTGRPTGGNAIYVRRVSPGRVIFGAAATGAPAAEGRPLDLDDETTHTIEVALGPWFTHGSPPLSPDQVRVTLDGRRALAVSQPFRPFRPAEVWLLQNPFAVPGCDLDFTGSVEGVASVDAAERARATDARLGSGTGPITALLQFNGPTLGVGLGLLETGVTGAGDIVSVVMLDPTHARFSFDHWGVGGFTGSIVPVDPEHVYRCRIELGSLQPADPSRPQLATQVRVALDGRVVLAGHSAFHPARTGQLHFMANALGSSGVGVPFDGTCVSVERGP
jgi:hypothetical protein